MEKHATTSQETRKRSFLKALSWRCLATFTTFTISFIVTGNFAFAVSIGGIEVIAKIILYYFHERAWEQAKFWRKLDKASKEQTAN